jgi:recombination protein U
MAKNVGKVFEEDFSSSIPSYCYVHRLRDSAQSYNKSKDTSFTWDNECDFFIWDSCTHIFYAIECKTTKYKSMSVQLDKDDKSQKMIKLHQIESLTKISEYDGAIAGFFLNFRDEKNNTQRTYFLNIIDFNKIIKDTEKKSINEIDIILNNGIKISGEKKRVRFRWDIDEFLKLNSKM